ncbi:peptidoglycan/xylan/chitin deacetylase (PgdA/CDA1 family) [Allocatelliglobosispora scoriae]|uniref:Peptidoglycan/xylan/chitin deacetylase (PgdA/CDA1 family) n=1 Tax=Allocatelliglobosispora scoriae TaxID=643052 RepID=A0A841BU41_9ACTN|nr:polysaccharide deacetylase family protein [Allocatelliglobosispora scoriae]MBB5870968.1 peptidoglycan/xylan/chitin deacetylase (PgdA/CDA1 family) [Allocatelliglobosispora scoriae]
MRMRTLVSVSLALLLAAGAGACSAKSANEAAGTPTPGTTRSAEAPGTSPEASPEPSQSPESEPSPSPGATGSPSPSGKPNPGGKNEIGVVGCRTGVPSTKPIATGTGPGGSLLSTGTQGVALTFDDGPDPINTPKILDLLKNCGVKATFCLVGFRARDRPDLVRRIVAEGHTLCNHSWQHLFDLRKRTDQYILHDLGKTNDEIHKIVPGAPISWFRAPGGNFTKHLVDLAGSLGMRSIYWKIDPRDWESAKFGHGSSMVNHIIGAVQSQTRPGAIILSHDNGKPDTITAYKTLLPWLKARFILIPLPVPHAP